MNTNSRLDRVLNRTRKHLALDIAMAAFLPVAMILSGLALGMA